MILDKPIDPIVIYALAALYGILLICVNVLLVRFNRLNQRYIALTKGHNALVESMAITDKNIQNMYYNHLATQNQYVKIRQHINNEAAIDRPVELKQ